MEYHSEIILHHRQASCPPVIIERVPEVGYGDCRITLSMTPEVAKLAAEIAAPFLATLSRYADTRTEWERKQEELRERSAREHIERERKLRAILIGLAREVYRDGLHYHDATRRLEARRFGVARIEKRVLHTLYHDCRARAARRMRERGSSNREIGTFFGVSKQAVTVILKRLPTG